MRAKRLVGFGLVLVAVSCAAATLVFGQQAAAPQPNKGLTRGQPPQPPQANVWWRHEPNSVADPSRPDGEDAEWGKLAAEEAKAVGEAEALTQQYGEAGDEKTRDEIKSKLSAALEKQFHAQQMMRELEISRIEERVHKLRDLLGRRNDARRTIIEKRLDQIIRDVEGLGWNPPANRSVTTGSAFEPGLDAPRGKAGTASPRAR